jgi:hypothetical protein
MIPLNATMDMFGIANTSAGVSPEAYSIEALVRDSVDHYLEPRLSLLLPEIESLGDSSGGTSTVADEDTIQAAIRFAYCLPRFGPLPEIALDPDGEISFDWIAPSGTEMFSVSVNKENRLAFAGRFSEKSKVHGIEQMGEGCPPEILRGIEKATRRSWWS